VPIVGLRVSQIEAFADAEKSVPAVVGVARNGTLLPP
jgi:hypothetical protein